jgi:hypothetical protein
MTVKRSNKGRMGERERVQDSVEVSAEERENEKKKIRRKWRTN